MTKEEKAIVGAYTGILMGDFSALHQYVEKIMGHPVWTHEMGNPEFAKRVKEAAEADFLGLCGSDK